MTPTACNVLDMTTNTITNLEAATPVEIDTVLAEIWGRSNAVEDRIAALADEIQDAQERLQRFTQPSSVEYYEGRIAKAEAQIPQLQAELALIKAEAKPFEDEYRRRPWTRAFLVTNSNGHVHAHRHCGTCRITTRYAWLIDYSGKDETEIVTDAGCMACTVCFPSAPVETLALPTKMFASEEDRIKAEKKAAAPAPCPGSGTWDYPRETARTGYYSGNYGICSHCNEATTITSTGKMRKHKA